MEEAAKRKYGVKVMSMFAGQREQTEKKNIGKIMVGYDLGKTSSQISYCTPDASLAETVSSVAGTEQFNIPTVLCKRNGVNQWYYGKEALKYAQSGEGVIVEDLLTLAVNGEDVLVEEECYDPVALLTLFVKRSLSLLNMQVPLKNMEAIMFTVEDLSPRMVDVLSKVAAGLQLKIKNIYFQSYVESFYYYVLHQPAELWKNKVLIFDYNHDMKSYCFEYNKKTVPQVVFITGKQYPIMPRVTFPEEPEAQEAFKREMDEKFIRIVEGEVSEDMISTVYLLGDGFKGNWTTQSLKMICRNRRVFQGNNLYSKGACYGAVERISPSEAGKEHVFLGKDKLKANIGMKVLRQGEDSYFAVLDAGTNWYEAKADYEVILDNDNVLEFLITPLTGEKLINRQIILEGLPERPRRCTRLRIQIEMTTVNQASLTIEDLGFGEIFQSSGKGWSQTISLSDK